MDIVTLPQGWFAQELNENQEPVHNHPIIAFMDIGDGFQPFYMHRTNKVLEPVPNSFLIWTSF